MTNVDEISFILPSWIDICYIDFTASNIFYLTLLDKYVIYWLLQLDIFISPPCCTSSLWTACRRRPSLSWTQVASSPRQTLLPIDHYFKTSLVQVQVDNQSCCFFVACLLIIIWRQACCKLIISPSAFYVEFLLEKSLLADLSILIDYLIHSSWVQVNLWNKWLNLS